jgi:neopullulanase
MRLSKSLRAAAVLVLLATLAFAEGVPAVQKVDPPNWWLGMPSPMLLVKGENLARSRVISQTPGVSITRTRYEASGHYLLLWLNISPGAKPGPVRLMAEGRGTTVRIPFSLAIRQPRTEGFRGIGPEDVIYLIMPDRFADADTSNDSPAQSPGTYDRSKPRAYHGGDLRGIRDHLQYLRDLGVTTLWICPIYDNDNHSPEDYHGYAAVDFYAVDEHFGTLADFEDMVASAHKLGLKVVLDTVVNHTGMKHPWLDLQPEPGWYNGTRAQHSISDGAFPLIVDPHAPPRLWEHVVDGWFFNVLPDLNQNNPDMAQYLVQNGIWWAEQGALDGFRLDTFPYVPRKFWAKYHRQLHRIYPHFDTIGEVFNPDPTITSFFVGGQPRWDGIDSGVNTVFDFPLFFALRDVVLKNAPASNLVDVLRQDWLYPHPEKLVTFIGNHDTARFMGEPGATKQKLKLAFSLLLTMRGVPQLYYGDELGMPGGGDPDNRRDFPGGFPGDTHNAFTAEGRTEDEEEIFAHVQRLLKLRQQHSALRRGRQWHIDFSKDFYAYAREDGEERMLMVFNHSGAQHHFHLEFAGTPLASVSRLEPLLDASPAAMSGDVADLDVAADSVAIYDVH